MSTHAIEEYEKELENDPRSLKFIDLAKLCLEQNDPKRAISACEVGIAHHPNSMLGRVLWGKALLELGRSSDAMKQFEGAINIDRENARAYNLVGEALVNKGLYRSAVPVLKKASSLQPGDHRVSLWLQQAVAATAPKPSIAPKPSAPLKKDSDDDEPTRITDLGSLPIGSKVPDRPDLDVEEPTQAFSLESMAHLIGASAAKSDAPIIEGIPASGAHPIVAEPSERTVTGGNETISGMSEMYDALAAGVPVLTPSPEPGPAAPEQPATTRGLLGDVPWLESHTAETTDPSAIRTIAKSPEAIQAAKEYERELRSKLEEKAAQKSFLQRHGLKLALFGVPLVLACSFLAFYQISRTINGGKDVPTLIDEARREIDKDTHGGYSEALKDLTRATELSKHYNQAWALKAYVQAMLFDEYEHKEELKQAAVDSLEKSDAKNAFSDLALLVDYHLQKSDASREAIIHSSSENAWVHTEAALLLLEKNQNDAALPHLENALKTTQAMARTWFALGTYYANANDWANVIKNLSEDAAKQAAATHPGRLLLLAEARLRQNTSVDEALKDIEGLQVDSAAAPVSWKRDWLWGRLLAVQGQQEKSLEVLKKASAAHPEHAVDFSIALSEALLLSGSLNQAESEIEKAIKLSPKSVGAAEMLARIYLAEGQDAKLIKRFSGDTNKPLIPLKAIAFRHLKNIPAARIELEKLQLKGQVPIEVAVELALCDAADGMAEQARTGLEKLLPDAKKKKALVQVALGAVYEQLNENEKARGQYEAAIKDSANVEAMSSLGQLLIRQGKISDGIVLLKQALQRNGSDGSAYASYIKALLQTGAFSEATASSLTWTTSNPESGTATLLLARSLYLTGKLKPAETAANKALKLLGETAETTLLKAQILYSQGDGESAFKYLQKANHLEPHSGRIFCEIAMAFVRQSNNDMAKKAYEAAQREDKQQDCGTIGMIALNPTSVSASKAHALLSKLTSAYDVALGHYVLSRVAMSNRKWDEAKREADIVSVKYPPLAHGQMALALWAMGSKDVAAAESSYRKAIGLDPTWAALHLALGDLLRQKDGQEKEAIAEYNLFLMLCQNDRDRTRIQKLVRELKKKSRN